MDEKNLINRSFFVIDSQNVKECESHFYGYCFDAARILNSNIEAVNGFIPNEQPGAWLYVERLEHEIVIHQDVWGSWGLYLFEMDGYFAISNSFVMLVDHIKARYPLSINCDFANAMLTSAYCSRFVEQTLIREIRLISRHDRVHIDLKTHAVYMEHVDYCDISVPVDSKQGLELLDAWVGKWVNIIRQMKKQTNNMNVTLSGGMDSRIVFMLFLLARINFSETCISSAHSELHTFKEDYSIASRIAAHYNLSLNEDAFDAIYSPLSLDSMINLSFYTKLGFHKQMYFNYAYYEKPFYTFGGYGGECLKDYWKTIPKELQGVKEEYEKIHGFYSPLIPKEEFLACLCRESEVRSHHGKQCVEGFLANHLFVAPLADSLLRKLSLCSKNCLDANLLYAVIFTRYCPDILDFPFDSGHSIHVDTLAYARKINEIRPFCNTYAYLPVQSREEQIKTTRAAAEKKFVSPIYEILGFLRKCFDSKKCKDTFVSVFASEAYEAAGKYADEVKFFPLQQVYMVLAVVKAIQDTCDGKNVAWPTPYDYFASLIDT